MPNNFPHYNNNGCTLHDLLKIRPDGAFWCYKTLPLTYDDSLSYYEVLCKNISLISKAMTDDVQHIEDMINCMTEFIQNMQDHLNQFIDEYNLNINRIDETVTSINNTINLINTRVLPPGGTRGQVLSKINSDDYNTQWIDQIDQGGGSSGLSPITVTRDEVYISTPTNDFTTKILADPTAPPERPINKDQIAVYSETNQSYAENDVTGTLLVADPHSAMEAVNKRTLDGYLNKANIDDTFKRITSTTGAIPGAQTFHVLSNNFNDIRENGVPMFDSEMTLYTNMINIQNTPTTNYDGTNKEYVDNLYNKVEPYSIINVLNYNVINDGQTDNTNALNTLFSSREGTFYFPKGDYVVTGQINIPSNSKIMCDGTLNFTFDGGAGCIIINTKQNVEIIGNFTCAASQITDGTRLIEMTNSQNILIHNTHFNFNNGTYEGIYGRECTNVKIINNTLLNTGRSGIVFQHNNYNINVSGNYVKCGTKIYTNNYGIQMSTYDNNDSTAYTNGFICANNICIFKHWEGIDCHSGYNGIITNNYVKFDGDDTDTGSCIMCANINNEDIINNLIISNNITISTGKHEGITAHGRNISIFNNTIQCNTGILFAFRNVGDNKTKATISSNHIKFSGDYGIRILPREEITVSNNDILGNANGTGIVTHEYQTSWCRIYVKNNIITDCLVDIQMPPNSPNRHNIDYICKYENNTCDINKVTNTSNATPDAILSSNLTNKPLLGRVGDWVKIIGSTNGIPHLLVCTQSNSTNEYTFNAAQWAEI